MNNDFVTLEQIELEFNKLGLIVEFVENPFNKNLLRMEIYSSSRNLLREYDFGGVWHFIDVYIESAGKDLIEKYVNSKTENGKTIL